MIYSEIPVDLSGSGKVFDGTNELASVRYELDIRGDPRRKPAIIGYIFLLEDQPNIITEKTDLTLHMQGYQIPFIVSGSYISVSHSLPIQCTGEFTRD